MIQQSTIPVGLANPSPGLRAWELVLAASCVDAGARELEEIHRLIERGIDWTAVLRVADDHGTSALVYRNCSALADAIPASVLKSLRERYEENVRRSLFLTRELIRILHCLDSLAIEAISYKGTALAEIYYGDMAMRWSGDIDLFVRKGEATPAKKAVSGLGFVPRVAVPKDAERDYLDSGYEYTFDSPAGTNLLELQWSLQPRFYAVDYDMDGLFRRTVTVEVGGRAMKMPSAEDLLLILAVHAAKHVWERLIWLCDIAQVMKREKLDWDCVQSRAREFGIERILHVTLLLENRWLRSPIPAAMEAAMAKDQSLERLTDEIASAVTRGVSYEDRQVFYFRLMMRLRERKADRLRFLTRLTFTPGPGEWKAVRLPRILFPLYRAVRLARLAGKLGSG